MANDVSCSKQKSNENVKNNENSMDSSWSWMIVVAAFSSNTISDGILYTMGMIEEELLVEFNESKLLTSWVPSIVSGMQLCGGPIASQLINRYSCHTVAIIGSLLSAISFLISAYAQSVFALIIIIGFGSGTGFCFLYCSAIVSIGMNFEKYRSVATGIASAGTGCGTFLFSPLVAFFIEKFGWRKTMLILSGILLNCVIFGALFRPLKRSMRNQGEKCTNQHEIYTNHANTLHKELDRPENKKIEIASKAYCGCNLAEILKSIFKFMNFNLLKNPVFVLLMASSFVTSTFFYVPIFLLPSYSSALGMKELGPSILMITGISNTLGRLFWGYVSNKTSNRIWIYSTSLVICGIATALFTISIDFVSLSICSAVFAFTASACCVLSSVILADLLGLDQLNNAFGLILFTDVLGTFIGPPIYVVLFFFSYRHYSVMS
ncbi:monocarboxylate transporter 14-like isoform X2 [Contarinia nasturtii]|uniref:monocarboxylate transporter 14-like isoform X2 n=1 Tax=Contarinia nasturtii TaxID=265458 RepID=UPI0012D4AF50|nr:monocarboxylate transporter 14-like isoform X2 [Contarinia nasturtii]